MRTPFHVLYLDNHLLIVDKPAGVLTQGDATGDASLDALAKAYLKRKFDKPGNVFAAPAHRLDRPVSGVVAIARTSKAASRLAEQFRARSVEKRYVALVDGRLTGEGTREDWLVKDRKGGQTHVRRSKEGKAGAKRAVLRWRTLSVESRRTLVEVVPETGRPHQIRVQLAALGHPIQGDLRYGAERPFTPDRALALHAHALALDHPTQKDRRTFRAPLPKHWPEVPGIPRGGLVPLET